MLGSFVVALGVVGYRAQFVEKLLWDWHPRRDLQRREIGSPGLLIVVLATGCAWRRGPGSEPSATRSSVERCTVSDRGGDGGARMGREPSSTGYDDLAALGVPLPVTVVGGDPHDLDEDGNGRGCEP